MKGKLCEKRVIRGSNVLVLPVEIVVFDVKTVSAESWVDVVIWDF